MSYDTEARLSSALQGIAAGDRPYHPDFDKIENRGRKLRRRRWALGAGGGTFAVAAIAAVAVSVTGVQAPTHNIAAPGKSSAAPNGQLVELAAYLSNEKPQPGDATLIQRDQDGIEAWDLHADNGNYYFARTRAALPAQVKGKKLQGEQAGRIKAVQAARDAAKGDLKTARAEMAYAYDSEDPKKRPTLEAPGSVPVLTAGEKTKLKITGGTAGNLTDNWVWNDSIDALISGAGDPLVRAGVLRLLGQMSEVKVAQVSVKGQGAYAITAGTIATGDKGETLTINAETGLPIQFTVVGGGAVNYTVSRVSIAAVAAGKF